MKHVEAVHNDDEGGGRGGEATWERDCCRARQD